MNVILNILAAGVLCWGCIATASGQAAGHITDIGGFVDIDLPIAEIKEEASLVRIVARGDVDGALAGFEVDFPSKGGRSNSVSTPLPLGVARFRSIGAASNKFVALLARQYRLPALAAAMVPTVDASVVGLEGDPAHVLDGVTQMKFFFFDSGPEDRYAEVFVNVDAKNRTLQFHEKDADYRKPLILALTRRL